MPKFPPGQVLWVPDDEHAFLPVQLEQTGKGADSGEANVKATTVGSVPRAVVLSAAQTKDAEPTDMEGCKLVEDMVKLADLREASILHNLRERFAGGDIYTKIGTILVSVNPFQVMDIYTAEILEAYARSAEAKAADGTDVLPPHVYQVADMAYRDMVSDGTPQACLVSGESGAGKTEATKVMLHFLAEMSAKRASEDWGEQSRLQDQILKANPLMEAFGNAKTVRNSNSSRFGKYIEVRFNSRQGTIIGGAVTQYLLEKSRIVYQSKGERNYHIFYQLCAGGHIDPELRKRHRVTDIDQYRYLFDADASVGINDERGWEETMHAMEALGMSTAERDDVVRTVAGVLHLGNITFVEKKVTGVDQACEVADKQLLELAAYQLGVPVATMATAMTQKALNISNAGGGSVSQMYSIAQAEDVRDVMAKAVYCALFDWLIRRINWALNQASKAATLGQKLAHGITQTEDVPEDKPGDHPQNDLTGQGTFKVGEGKSSIGVLDIFGFESFVVNSFEQLCINYCNEKLQGFFTEHIFRLEQAEYKAEGIQIDSVGFSDNEEVLVMLETPRTGVFGIINDELSVPRGTDESMLAKLVKRFDGDAHFKKDKKSPITFGIIHFAGEVQYTVTGFLTKNRDALPADVQGMLELSQHRLMRVLFAVQAKDTSAFSANRGTVSGARKSLIVQFKDQLSVLMTTLALTAPHFIRCIKPNKLLKAKVFQSPMVLEQLRYSGLLDVCKIRKKGYPVRKENGYFAWRYGVLLGRGTGKSKGVAKEVAEALERRGLLKQLEWRIGLTKVFLKSEAYERLELSREKAVGASATYIQAAARGRVHRNNFRQARALLKDLTAKTKAKDLEAVEALLLKTGELPYQGRHLKPVLDARQMMQKVLEERRAEVLLVEAIAGAELAILQSALQTCTQLGYNSPSVEKGKKLVQSLLEEQKVFDALVEAVKSRELAKLVAALDRAKPIARLMQDPVALRAQALLQRMETEQKAIAVLDAALKAGNSSDMQKAVAAMVELGMGGHALVADAVKRGAEQAQKSAASQAKFDETVRLAAEATKTRDLEMLVQVQTSCVKLGVKSGDSKVLDEALAMLADMEQSRGFTNALLGARKALAVKAKRAKGLEASDIKELIEAVEKAVKGGVGAENPDLKAAQDAVRNAHAQIVAQQDLAAVLADKAKARNYDLMKKALAECEGIDMNSVDVFVKVSERVKQMELDGKRQENKLDKNLLDEDALEKLASEQMERAKGDGYFFGNYYKVRSDADFAKGIMFSKNKPQDVKLLSHPDVIHKSLLELPQDLSRQAVRLNRSILGYCGDVVMSFPAALAQDLVERALATRDLDDEIYMQICKHLNKNPDMQSTGRAWQLMCICVGAFPPSDEFELYLMNFLLRKQNEAGIHGTYAQYALRRLQSTLMFGPTQEHIAVDEIIAYGDRPPVMATIMLVDGTPITDSFPIPPHMKVEDVLNICVEFLAMTDARKEMFGLFVKEQPMVKTGKRGASFVAFQNKKEEKGFLSDLVPEMMPPPPPMPDNLDDLPPPPMPDLPELENDAPPRASYPLEASQHLGDVVQALNRKSIAPTFVFRRKIFLSGGEAVGDDMVFNRLLYLQALDETIAGNWLVPDQSMCEELVSIAMAVDLGEDMPTTVKGLIGEGLMDYVPIPWRPKRPAPEWAQAVLQRRDGVYDASVEDLQLVFLQIASELPTYGATVFFIRQQESGSDFVACIDAAGLHIVTLKDRKLLRTITYGTMLKFGGTSRTLKIDTKSGEKIVLWTSQAKEMASLVVDYTQWIQKAKATPAPKKAAAAPATKKDARSASTALPPPPALSSQALSPTSPAGRRRPSVMTTPLTGANHRMSIMGRVPMLPNFGHLPPPSPSSKTSGAADKVLKAT